jgi:hypothetical protein
MHAVERPRTMVIQTGRATADHGEPRRGTGGKRTRVLVHTMSRNAGNECSDIPYDCWCVGKEEGSRMGDRRKYQQPPPTPWPPTSYAKCEVPWGSGVLGVELR